MTRLRYTSKGADFPADAPIGAPHIVDTAYFDAETNKQDLRLADGIATHLYRYNPPAAKAFFDLNRAKFEYYLRKKEDYMDNVLIARLGRVVQVGYMNREGGYSILLMFYLSTSERRLVPISGMDHWAGIDTHKASVVDRLGGTFAASLLYSEDWKAKDGREVTMLWTKIPHEEGYGETDVAQVSLYGLPEGWERMSDEELGIPTM